MAIWDEKKRKQVIKDHGIDLAKITDIFEDPFGVYFEDHQHSTDEEKRFDVIAKTSHYGLVFSTFVYVDEGGDVRFITARRAEGWMVRDYERNRKRL